MTRWSRDMTEKEELSYWRSLNVYSFGEHDQDYEGDVYQITAINLEEAKKVLYQVILKKCIRNETWYGGVYEFTVDTKKLMSKATKRAKEEYDILSKKASYPCSADVSQNIVCYRKE